MLRRYKERAAARKAAREQLQEARKTEKHGKLTRHNDGRPATYQDSLPERWFGWSSTAFDPSGVNSRNLKGEQAAWIQSQREKDEY